MASSTSAAAPLRSWEPHSKKWRKEFEELANMPDKEVTRRGKLIFVPDNDKFQIADRGHTEVLLGLRDDGTEVAIKKIKKSKLKMINEELKVLLGKKHNSQHVVQYADYTDDGKFAYIAMQLCERNLYEFMETEEMEMDTKTKIAKEFLKGLKELHDEGVIHRDIKPSNVLIETNGRVRLADFGISRTLHPDRSTVETSRGGTICWEATEIVKNSLSHYRYKRSTDIQVAGMLVYYILSGGHHPFGDVAHCQANIADGKYSLDHPMDKGAKDLVESMINPNPHRRPCIKKVLEHPFFSEDKRHSQQSWWSSLVNWTLAKTHCEVLIYEHCSMPLVLHVYLVPSPSLASQAVEEITGGRRIIKPQPHHSLYIGSTIRLSTSAPSEITPTEMTFTNRMPPAFFEVVVKQEPPQEFMMEFITEENFFFWKVVLRNGMDFHIRQDQDNTTGTPDSLTEPQVGSQMAAAFLEESRPELIQRVSEVMPIADRLLSQMVIGQETYAKIQAAASSQDKMRLLFHGLRSAGAQGKLAFYTILQEQHPHLVEELWSGR